MVKRIWLPVITMFTVFAVLSLPGWGDEPSGAEKIRPRTKVEIQRKMEGECRGKKILWVDSYNEGYEWSDGIERGIRDVLNGSGVTLKIFRMDTKRSDLVEFGKKAGLAARTVLEKFQPDVVIATDDNAQKYLVVPYLKNTNLPVVFGGVNWDASMYGYPCKNVTGMIEVDLIEQLVRHFKQYARGNRIGFLSADVETERKISDSVNKRFFDGSMKVYLVKTFDQFKKEFLRVRNEVDMLIISNYTGIKDWDSDAAERFLVRNTNIPTGAFLQFMGRFVVFTLGNYPEEQGEYVARTALKILAGAKPSDFPIVTNKRAKLTVNLKMAKSAGIVFPVSLLKVATVIGQEAFDEGAPVGGEHLEPDKYKGKRILWVDSYHEGYEWSDGIEKGIRDALAYSGVNLKVVHMDTKRNDSVAFGRKAGLEAKAVLEEFKPDVVIASDDNAQKYLVVPYLKGTDHPVVFCGVNWDASMYGYPSRNVTGMVEVELVNEMVRLFKQYAKGDRIGYLSGDVETERKIVEFYNQAFFDGKMKIYLVRTFDEFKKEFLRAQEEVDMLCFSNYSGIAGWDPVAAKEFLARNTRIPTGSSNAFMAPFVLFTVAKYPEEQGSYAARTALKILDGVKPGDIPLRTNRRSQLTVNLKMAKSAGIVLPVSILKNATVIGQEALRRE